MPYATVWNNAIIVDDAPADDPRLNACFVGTFNTRLGKWFLPRSLAAGRRIIRNVPDVRWSKTEPTRIFLDALNQWDAAQAAKQTRPELLPDIPGEKLPSWGHQKPAHYFARLMEGCGLWQGMGTGKSKEIFDLIRVRNHRRILVITTASAIYDWNPENPNSHTVKHGWDDLRVLALDEWIGPKGGKNKYSCKEKLELINAALADQRQLIVVLSYQSMIKTPLGPVMRGGRIAHPGGLLKIAWDCIVADEVHRISDPNSRSAKILYSLGDRVRFRIGASGTMIRHKPHNAFGVMRFIDPGAFGTSFPKFADRYCTYNVPSQWELKKQIEQAEREAIAFMEAVNVADINAKIRAAEQPGSAIRLTQRVAAVNALRKKRAALSTVPRFIDGYKNEAELSAIMHQLCIHVDKSVLKLPVPIDTIRRCKLGVRASRMYAEMEEKCFTMLADDEGFVDAPNKMTAMLRLQQLTGGFIGGVENESGETIEHKETVIVDDAKVSLLAEVLDNIDPAEPIAIFCRFRPDIEQIRATVRKAGWNVFEQSGKRKEKNKFLNSLKGSALIGQIASVAEAIDLSMLHYGIFYSLGFSLDQYQQVRCRLDRPGQTAHPNFIHLIASGTIDEYVYQSLAANQTVIDYITKIAREKFGARC
jgi:hypothetical protein